MKLLVFKNKLIFYTFIILAGCLITIAILFYFFSAQNKYDFNSELWKKVGDVNSSGGSVRLKMVDGLLKNYSLVGMKKEQLNSLLGVPEKTNYFKEYDYVYYLGPERSYFSVDSEWLGIKFKNDLVSEVKILKD